MLWNAAATSDTKVCWPCGGFIWRNLEPVKPFTFHIQKVAEPFPEHLRPPGVREVVVQGWGGDQGEEAEVGWMGDSAGKGKSLVSHSPDPKLLRVV